MHVRALSTGKRRSENAESFSKPSVSANRPAYSLHPGFDFGQIGIMHPRLGEPGDAYEQQADRIAKQISESSQSAAGYRKDALPFPAKAKASSGSGMEGGSALDRPTREFVEPLLDHDFGNVRVHDGPAAAAAARMTNAMAFTTGNDIVFGKGQYRPDTLVGRRLLVHELVHVVQQNTRLLPRRYIQRQPAGQQPQQVTSDPAESREYVNDAIHFLELGTELYVSGGRVDEAGLERQLRGWGTLRTSAEETIRIGLGNDVTLVANLRQAYQAAVRAVITAAAVQLRRTAHELYEAHRGIIHEWAWPQGSAAAGAGELSDSLPEAERRRIRVVTTPVTIGNIDDLFSTQGGRTTVSPPANVSVNFASGIVQSLRHGLGNVAGELTQMNPPLLEVNSTITLALDLERYGDDYAAFRFTRVEHRPARGAPTQEILIERLGSIGMEGLPPSQVQANQERFDRHSFRRSSGWSTPQFESLLAAIAQIPDSMLSPVDGIGFERQSVHPTNPDTGGEYDPKNHTITMFDKAFGTSMTRFGMPAAGLANLTMQNVIHEIGHAIDLLPLRQTWSQLEQAQDALHTAFAQYEDPPGSRQYRFPSSEQTNWNSLQQRITAAEQARDQARSRSGFRWQRNAQGVFEHVQGGAAAGSNAFRLAAQQDGAIRITHYSDTDWGEYFAESFSMYIAAPDTLRRLRPHVYDYFVANFPR